jgi:hypothetical protein
MVGLVQQHLDASGEDHRHRCAPAALLGLSDEPDPSCAWSVIGPVMSSHMSESSYLGWGAG